MHYSIVIRPRTTYLTYLLPSQHFIHVPPTSTLIPIRSLTFQKITRLKCDLLFEVLTYSTNYTYVPREMCLHFCWMRLHCVHRFSWTRLPCGVSASVFPTKLAWTRPSKIQASLDLPQVCFAESIIAIKHHLSRRASFEADHPAFKQQTRKAKSGRPAERNANRWGVGFVFRDTARLLLICHTYAETNCTELG